FHWSTFWLYIIGIFFFFFFFSSRRRHTRSLRDWSSDVCSSDLVQFCGHESVELARPSSLRLACHYVLAGAGSAGPEQDPLRRLRSEERRVGKECRSRGWRDQCKKKVWW